MLKSPNVASTKPSKEDFETARKLCEQWGVTPSTDGSDQNRKYIAQVEFLAEMRAKKGREDFDVQYGLREPRSTCEKLTADLCQGKLTPEEFKTAAKADANRPIDADMLRVWWDCMEENIVAYSRVLQCLVKLPSEEIDEDSNELIEKNIDDHIKQMTAKLPLWTEQLGTLHLFLMELRSGQDKGPVRIGDRTGATVHDLLFDIFDKTARNWESCKRIAQRSQTDPRYVYATTARDLMIHSHSNKPFPKADELSAMLKLEYAAAKIKLERQSILKHDAPRVEYAQKPVDYPLPAVEPQIERKPMSLQNNQADWIISITVEIDKLVKNHPIMERFRQAVRRTVEAQEKGIRGCEYPQILPPPAREPEEFEKIAALAAIYDSFHAPGLPDINPWKTGPEKLSDAKLKSLQERLDAASKENDKTCRELGMTPLASQQNPRSREVLEKVNQQASLLAYAYLCGHAEKLDDKYRETIEKWMKELKDNLLSNGNQPTRFETETVQVKSVQILPQKIVFCPTDDELVRFAGCLNFLADTLDRAYEGLAPEDKLDVFDLVAITDATETVRTIDQYVSTFIPLHEEDSPARRYPIMRQLLACLGYYVLKVHPQVHEAIEKDSVNSKKSLGVDHAKDGRLQKELREIAGVVLNEVQGIKSTNPAIFTKQAEARTPPNGEMQASNTLFLKGIGMLPTAKNRKQLCDNVDECLKRAEGKSIIGASLHYSDLIEIYESIRDLNIGEVNFNCLEMVNLWMTRRNSNLPKYVQSERFWEPKMNFMTGQIISSTETQLRDLENTARLVVVKDGEDLQKAEAELRQIQNSLLGNKNELGTAQPENRQEPSKPIKKKANAAPSNWLTVTEAAQIFLDENVVDDMTLEKTKARVSLAASQGMFKTNNKKGKARRIDRDSFSTWLLQQRKRNLESADPEPATDSEGR